MRFSTEWIVYMASNTGFALNLYIIIIYKFSVKPALLAIYTNHSVENLMHIVMGGHLWVWLLTKLVSFLPDSFNPSTVTLYKYMSNDFLIIHSSKKQDYQNRHIPNHSIFNVIRIYM